MEMMVAMTLLGLLMTALSGSIGFVGKSWDKGWRITERSAALAQVESTIRRLVERSFPVTLRLQKKDRFLFQGTAQALRLVAYDAAGRSAPGLYVQEIAASGAGNQRRLTYRQYPFTARAAQSSGTEATILMGDFSFGFSYFGSPRRSVQPAWFETWESDQALPDLIRLQILEGGAAAWPPIVVHPMITAEYACIDTSIAGICRLGASAP